MGGKELEKNVSGRSTCAHAEASMQWVLRSSSGRSLQKPSTLCKGVVRSQLDRRPPASSETCCQPDQEGGALPQLPVRVTNVMDLHVWLGVFHNTAIQYCV